MRLIDCDFDPHAPAILAIFNHAIAHSTALYEYQPRSLDTMRAWFDAKRAGDFPVIGLEEEGRLLGFASYGQFRPFAAFKYTLEHSIYIAEGERGRGLGARLLQELVVRARQRQAHVLIGAIDADNAASRALHTRHGFEHVGTVREAGYKFGRWLDMVLYQRILDTPAQPSEG